MGRKLSGAIRTDKVIQKQKNGDRYVYERQSKYSPEKGYYVPISSICLGKMKPGSDDKNDLLPLRPKAKSSRVNESEKIKMLSQALQEVENACVSSSWPV